MKTNPGAMGSVSIGALVIAGLTAATLPCESAASPSIIEVRATVRSVDDFREPLSEHGQWMDTEEYGTVWQPYVAIDDASWRPYYQGGYWVWTNRGWYWQSTYAWGWAPFHYGRWASADVGWVWVPDTVWTPACVEWKRTRTHVGWAPLRAVPRQTSRLSFEAGRGGLSISIQITDDERYCFVPERFLPEPNVITYVVPREQRTVIYRESASTVYVIREEPRGYRHHDSRRDDPRRNERRDEDGWSQVTGQVIVHSEPDRQQEPPRSISVNPGRRTAGLQQVVTRDRAPATAAPARTDPRNPGTRSQALVTAVAPAPEAPAPRRSGSLTMRGSAVQMQASAKPSSTSLDAFRRRMKGE